MVRCKQCGGKLSGAMRHRTRSYIHLDGNRSACTCARPQLHVGADLLEAVVRQELYKLFSDPKAIEQNVQAHCSTSALREKDELKQQLQNRRAQLEKQIRNLMAKQAGYPEDYPDKDVLPLLKEWREGGALLTVE